MGFADDSDNYVIRDDNKAYTEDNVCVYNLFIFKIPPKVKEEDMFEYFQQFGEVTKVRLVNDRKGGRNRRKAPKVGFVHYADALVAAKVLQMRHHSLNSKRISIKACDSWHQPRQPTKTDGVINDPTSEDSSADPEGSNTGSANEMHDSDLNTNNGLPAMMHILDLNDDCLEKICRTLKIREQVRFTLVCRRFRSIFQMCCKREHKTVELDKFNDMTLWEIREFFKVAGPTIKTLVGVVPVKDRERVVEFISNFSPNVMTINLDRSKIKSGCLRKLVDKMKSIVEMQLCDCSLTDSAVLALKKLPKLEILALSENYELTGKHLSKLTNLRKLNLLGCGNIQPTYFIEVCKTLKELHTLNIQRCERLQLNVFAAMEVYCLKLESLQMSYLDIPYDHIARLPALKRFEVITSSVTVRPGLFTALSQHMSNKLEYLHIFSPNCITLESAGHISQLSKLKTLICERNVGIDDECLRKFCDLENLEEIVLRSCCTFTNVGLLNLVRHCPKLKRVNIQCTNITNQFVFDVIEFLRFRQSKQPKDHTSKEKKDPIIFYVYKSAISNFIMNDAKCQNTSSLLKLCFHYTFNIYNEQGGIDINDFLLGEDLDEFDDEDSDEDADFMVDIDDEDAYHMYEYSDYDDDDLHDGYNMFGRYSPFGDGDL